MELFILIGLIVTIGLYLYMMRDFIVYDNKDKVIISIVAFASILLIIQLLGTAIYFYGNLFF